jgi:hypothetical protein
MSFEYKRHGTQTLIAAFNVTTGEVEARWQYQDGKGFHAVSPPP